MASLAVQPYAQFTFLMDLGDRVSKGPQAGFQECSRVQKISGLNKSTDVTLKRGVIASSEFEDWLDQIRKDHRRAERTVMIMMQNENHEIVESWTLRRARIVKHVSGPLNARTAGVVAIEELIITGEEKKRD